MDGAPLKFRVDFAAVASCRRIRVVVVVVVVLEHVIKSFLPLLLPPPSPLHLLIIAPLSLLTTKTNDRRTGRQTCRVCAWDDKVDYEKKEEEEGEEEEEKKDDYGTNAQARPSRKCNNSEKNSYKVRVQ